MSMPIRITILNGLRVNVLLPALICFAQLVEAQVKDLLPVTPQDTVAVVTQLLKAHLAKQLRQSAIYQQMQQGKLKGLLKDSTAIDSMGRIVWLQMQQLKSKVVYTGRSVSANAGQVSKKLLQQQYTKLMQSAGIKELISQFTGVLQHPLLQWKGGSVNITGQVSPALFNNGSILLNSSTLIGSWAVLGLPLGMQFSRQDLAGPEYYCRNTFSFQFDRETYLAALRQKIKLKMDARDLLPDYYDGLQEIKKAALARLAASLDSINTIYRGGLKMQLAKLGGAEQILKTDTRALQEQLNTADLVQNTALYKNQLAQMQQQLNTGGKVNIQLRDSLLQSLQVATGTGAIINTILSFKEVAQKTGLLEKLQEAEQFSNSKIQQGLQDPDKLKSLVKEQLDLNGLQKLFLNMSQLKAGMNTVSLSPLTVSQYSNKGFNAAFVNHHHYLFIMAGKQAVAGNIFDDRLATPVFSTGNTAIGTRAGKGDITENHSHISLFSYKEHNSRYNNIVINTVPASTMVAAFSSRLTVNQGNSVDIEISKSYRKYNNQQNGYGALQEAGRQSKPLPAGENLIQQMAFAIQWKGESKKTDLAYDLQGTRTGKGYNNPGNLFISSGTTMFGGGLRKNFLKKQLQFSVKGNYREYEYSTNSTKWRSYNFSFQGKWKGKKGQYIVFGYMPCQSLRLQNEKKYRIGGSGRLSLDGNFRKRFGKINYQQNIGLCLLKNNYQAGSISSNNKSVLISSTQTITINRKSYCLSVQYNRANAAAAPALLNTQFNADAGYMYNICNGVMGSAAVHYNSIQGWFRQMGIRQTLSGQIGGRVVVSLYADIVKNIKVYRLNAMGNTRLDWSLQYLLK